MADYHSLMALRPHQLALDTILGSDTSVSESDLELTYNYATCYRNSSRDVEVELEFLDGMTCVRVAEKIYAYVPRSTAHKVASAKLVDGKAVVNLSFIELTINRHVSVCIPSAKTFDECDDVAVEAAWLLRRQYERAYTEEMGKTPLEDIIFTQLTSLHSLL